jgi:DNA adenine methylase
MSQQAPHRVPPLQWHGGQHDLAGRIVARMPPHVHDIEPDAGGLAVLLARDPDGVSEVVNDLDGRLTNFWKVLRDEAMFAEFRRVVEAVPFSEAEWRAARDRGDVGGPPSDRAEMVRGAASFFVFCRQSLAGRMTGFAPRSRRRTRRGMNEQASAWTTAVAGLPAVPARLRRVVVLNRPALDVLCAEDGGSTLFDLDPPYLGETRSTPEIYRFEMSRDEHRELLEVIRGLRGQVMRSGYPSALDDDALVGWDRYVFDRPNHAASGVSKARATEVLWCHFGGDARIGPG